MSTEMFIQEFVTRAVDNGDALIVVRACGDQSVEVHSSDGIRLSFIAGATMGMLQVAINAHHAAGCPDRAVDFEEAMEHLVTAQHISGRVGQ